MAKKKKQKHPHIDKSQVRKRKAKKWIQTYAGTDIIRDYRAHFSGVDVAFAVRELQEIGYAFEPDYVENLLTYRKIIKKRYNKRIREGISPNQAAPIDSNSKETDIQEM